MWILFGDRAAFHASAEDFQEPGRDDCCVIVQVRGVLARNLSAQVKSRIQVVAGRHLQVCADIDAQLGQGIVELCDRLFEALRELQGDATHELKEENFLVGEVVVDRSAADFCARGDLGHRD